MSATVNPTLPVDLDFGFFVKQREDMARAHYDGRATDYCFSLDRQMRQRMSSIPGLELAVKGLSNFALAYQKQLLSLQGVAVGPKQFPRIYNIVQDCAERLSIGIPQAFIIYDPVMNAYSVATEQVGTMIVLHSSLVEAMSDEELRFVIGHECGHIHNLHGVWATAGKILSNAALMQMAQRIPGAAAMLKLLAGAVGVFLNSWFRCQETTADRAGLICSGDIDTARHAMAKLATGGKSDILKDIDLDEYEKQLETSQATPVRLWEAQIDHPITSKRVAMIREFRDCDVLYRWRPEMRGDKAPRTKAEVDARCEEIVRVFLKKGTR